MDATKHRLIAIRIPDGLPETEPLCIVRQSTFDQAKAALGELIGDLDDYWNQQNDDCSPVSSATITRARQALAAMEAL